MLLPGADHAQGSCYQFPTVETDTALADFNDAACGSRSDRHRCPVLRVESRCVLAAVVPERSGFRFYGAPTRDCLARSDR